MFFLLRCFVCIGLVLFALGWRAPEGVGQQPPETGIRVVAPGKAPRRPQLGDSVRDLAQAGVDALAGVTRDKCLAAPRECAALLKSYEAAGRAR